MDKKDCRYISKIIALSLLLCGSFYMIEQFTNTSYLITTMSKIILFGVVVSIIYFIDTKKSIINLILPKGKKGDTRLGIILGIAVLVIVYIGYFIFKGMIDLDIIMKELTETSKVTKVNYPLVALYITFGNSFLEEIFFRGFIFLQLYAKGYKKTAYVFSAGLFAVYHVAIFKTWFNPIIIFITLIGLFLGGIIFNYINTKSKSIMNSWLVHIFADISIVSIGFIMFYF